MASPSELSRRRPGFQSIDDSHREDNSASPKEALDGKVQSLRSALPGGSENIGIGESSLEQHQLPNLSIDGEPSTSSRTETPNEPKVSKSPSVRLLGDEDVSSGLHRIAKELGADYCVGVNLPPINPVYSDEDLVDVDWFDIPNLNAVERKATQGLPRHPILLTLEWIGSAILYRVKHWIYKGYYDQRAKVLEQAHMLECNGHLSPKLFMELKNNVHDLESFKKITLVYIEQLSKNHFLDKKSRYHAEKLLMTRGDVAVWRYLNVISSINSLTHNASDASSILSPDECYRVVKDLKDVSENPEIGEEVAKNLTRVLARVRIIKWLDKLSDDTSRPYFKLLKDSLVSDDDASFRKHAIIAFNHTSRRYSGRPVLRHYFLELASALDKKRNRDPFELISHALMTDDFVTGWKKRLDELRELTVSVNEIEPGQVEETKLKFMEIYRTFGAVLREEKDYFCSDTLYSSLYGDFRDQWASISDHLYQLSKDEISSHQFCGCVNQNLDKIRKANPWPTSATTVIKGSGDQFELKPNVERKKVLCLTCSWGGGHRAAASAIEKYCNKSGYHYTAVDAPQEMFIGEDILQKAIGGDYSITKLYNTLVARQAWDVIRLLSKTQGSEDAPKVASEVEQALVRQRFLMEKPDLIVSSYSRHNHIFLQVAQELGIPVVHVQTDYEMKISSWPTPPEYAHFKMIAPTTHKAALDTIEGKLKDEQIAPIGYPLREEFIHGLSTEQVNSVRSTYGIPEDKKVISVMGGAISAETPWPNLILEKMRSGEMQDCHMVVVCGHNTPYQKKLNDFVEKYPELKEKVSILGFVAGQDIATIMSISKCLVTKPGGGTVAEALSMGTRLCLDQSDKSFMTWEQFNAKLVEECDLGRSFTSKDDFFRAIFEMLEMEDKGQAALRPDRPQDETYIELFDEMIQKAEADPECVTKRCLSKSRFTPPTLRRSADQGFRMESALSKMINHFGSLKAEDIFSETNVKIFSSSICQEMLNGKYIQYDSEAKGIKTSDTFSGKDTILLLEKLHQYMMIQFKEVRNADIEHDQFNNIHYFVHHYTLHLREVVQKASARFGGIKCDKSEIAAINKLLVDLDRYQASYDVFLSKRTPEEYLKSHGISDDESSRENLKNLDILFTTQRAKDEFHKWASLKTSYGRRKKINDYMMTPATAALTYLMHPLSYDMMKSMHIHRHMSAYNEKIEREPETHDILIRKDGVQVPVESIREDYTYFLNRTVHLESGKEVFYTHAKGIEFTSPDEWGDQVPLFKTKDRKTKDYRMEICTVVSPETHAWIRLKSPDGKVYSIGKFWDKNVDLPGLTERVKTVPAMLRVDHHEFKGEEAQTMRTKITLDQSQFEQALNEMQIMQKQYKSEDGGFNLASSNCAGFVKKMSEIANVEMETKFNVFEFIAGNIFTVPSSIRKFLYKHNKTRKAINVLFYPVSLLRNLLIYALGGNQHIGAKGLQKDNIFKSFWDVFRPNVGMVEHPMQVRTWQEVQKEEQQQAA